MCRCHCRFGHYRSISFNSSNTQWKSDSNGRPIDVCPVVGESNCGISDTWSGYQMDFKPSERNGFWRPMSQMAHNSDCLVATFLIGIRGHWPQWAGGLARLWYCIDTCHWLSAAIKGAGIAGSNPARPTILLVLSHPLNSIVIIMKAVRQDRNFWYLQEFISNW